MGDFQLDGIRRAGGHDRGGREQLGCESHDFLLPEF
jgi:hypothetical protein